MKKMLIATPYSKEMLSLILWQSFESKARVEIETSFPYETDYEIPQVSFVSVISYCGKIEEFV